jgi:hypothetical protein
LELLPSIGDPILRNKSELLLQTSLAHSLRATKGWSVDSVKHAYTRALQLCKESGFDEHTLPAVFGLWTWNFLRASLGEAQALAEQLLNAAQNVDDSVYKVLAHQALGFTLFAQGKPAAAHAALERSISMCEDSKAAAYLDLSRKTREFMSVIRRHGTVVARLSRSGVADLREARRYADASQHPFSEAMARTISLRVHQLRGEAAVVAGQDNAAIALCESMSLCTICHGFDFARMGKCPAGEFERYCRDSRGLEKERATGALLFESYTLGLLADACIRMNVTGKRSIFDQAQLRLDEEAPNVSTRLKYTACSEKRICDHVEIWIRRNVICVRALWLRANRKPNRSNLNFA